MKRWGEGRVTLLGDAAHPMTPDLGQGACQAIEDAAELAECLRGSADVARALRLYEDRRRGRTAEIARRSRLLDTVSQLENPLLCAMRNTAVRVMRSGFKCVSWRPSSRPRGSVSVVLPRW